MRLRDLIELLRVNQWYKNITVVIGFLYAYIILDKSMGYGEYISLIGVLILSCLISSSNYILNGLTDVKYDLLHPIKKNGVLPLGKISTKIAFFLMVLIFLFTIIVGYILFSNKTLISLILLFLASLLYNLKPIRLKNIPYVDVISESVNNPIRFSIGYLVLIDRFPNVFVLLLIWGLACILMTIKRINELKKYKKDSINYRKAFRFYSLKKLWIANVFYIIISLILLIYMLFSFF